MSFARHELRLGEPGYPIRLAESPRPPRTLYIAGDPACLTPGLAVIGARRATPYGLACARLLAGWAAGEGVPIVSGAARGCDQAAQQAAVDAGGASIAVLGCGADVDYPAGSRALLAHLRSHWAVVSELPWGQEPLRRAFPARNRIIAGLAEAVLIVEAGMPSGTFSTADHALAAGREVFAVPGSVFAPGCRGPNQLIRDGAPAIRDISDLAQELRACGLLVAAPARADHLVHADDPVARALVADAMRPDDIARELSLDIVEVLRRISALETSGLVMRYGDGRYGVARGGEAWEPTAGRITR